MRWASKFGLWVEPEMVNPDSDLYRAHPDWAMTTNDYEPTEGRNQLVLDLTNPDVQQYLIDTITDVIKLGNIEYIKWDMNRQFSDVIRPHARNPPGRILPPLLSRPLQYFAGALRPLSARSL